VLESCERDRCIPNWLPAIANSPTHHRTFLQQAADWPGCPLMPLLRVLFVVLFFVGCGEPRRGSELLPVTGTVLYNHQPVEDATVVFLPHDHKLAATARTDEEGRFELKTLPSSGTDDGAAPGNFHVTVRKNYMTPGDKEIWELPRAYGNAKTSLLTAVVAVDQTNDFTFEISERLSAPPQDSFSIVLIPDTQAYKGKGTKSQPESTDPLTNPIFAAHTQWISKNIERQKIVFVSHVGDIVDKNIPAKWELARSCMDVIHGKVPYGISVGNHDMTGEGDSSLFQEQFPKSRYVEFDWYGGAYEGSPMGPHISGNNANSYQLFSVGGMDFIFMHLECNAPDDALDWANQILAQHADRRALITSHMGWGPAEKPKQAEEYITGLKGRMRWSKIHGDRGNTPQQIWEKCYRKHKNLIAVFSGDQSRTRAYHAATPGDHGNIIHEFMQDYGQGELRLYRFEPASDRISVITFNSQTEELCTGIQLVPDRKDHQFQIDYSMDVPSPASSR
jgi:hypothetical protein